MAIRLISSNEKILNLYNQFPNKGKKKRGFLVHCDSGRVEELLELGSMSHSMEFIEEALGAEKTSSLTSSSSIGLWLLSLFSLPSPPLK